MVTSQPYPETILQSYNMWLWKPIYRKVRYQNQHYSMVIVGKPGSGKSYLSLHIAQTLYPRFKPSESVVFSAADFARIINNRKLPKAFPIIIDDSGLTAGSGDALTKEVKAISKIMQSVRSRNLIIILNLPNFFLLARSVRTLLEYYAEPVYVNRSEKICHAKFRILKVNPLSGEVYRYCPMITTKETHWTGYGRKIKQKIATMAFPKASNEICVEYEALKKQKMADFNTKQDNMLNKPLKENQYVRIKEVAELIKNDLAKFSKNGEVNLVKISTEYQINKSQVKQVLELLDFYPDRKSKKYLLEDFISEDKATEILEKLVEYNKTTGKELQKDLNIITP